MRDLITFDQKDYNPNGKVFKRPSVRAVIARHGDVLLIYSKKYDYYKFPGGGIEAGENHTEALLREVQEESGYRILPDSIREFGRVLRRQKDSYDENGIFEQENFYYFCDVEECAGEVALDDYEAEEGFTAVWIDPLTAMHHNRNVRAADCDHHMIERDSRVLDLVDLELRKRARAEHERATLRALGNPDYAEMLSFVEAQLSATDAENPGAKTDIAYSRFEHTKRVLGWAKRLYDGSDKKETLRYEDVMIATIFHDVGRAVAKSTNLPHAKAGVPITRDYLLSHGFDPERTEYICFLVGSHSDKHLMDDEKLDPNLLFLMEADLLDDMGALGIVMDCMITQIRNPLARFTDCLDHIMRYTHRMQQNNPMVSNAGRQLWEEKTRIVNEFTAALQADVEL